MNDKVLRIIESLKEAVAGNFSRVTVEGETWVRERHWRSISSAPKRILDEYRYGPLLLLCVDGIIAVGMWDRDLDKFHVAYPDGVRGEPTHWQLLPEPAGDAT